MRELKRKQYKKVWMPKEEEALAAGVQKYGTGNWRTILQYSQFARYLARKYSSSDLVCKWRNLTSRVSDEKLKTMSPKVKKVVTAHFEAVDAKNAKKSSAMAKRKERGITGSCWTVEEEEALAAGVAKYGLSKWRTILEDPKFGPILAMHPRTSLVNKWRSLTDRVSEKKLGKMSYKVRKVVDAYLCREVYDDQDDSHEAGEETERISDMEEDSGERTMSTEVRNVVDDVQNAANVDEAVKQEKETVSEMAEEDETFMMDAQNSADPADAVKETERISKMREEAESMLALAKEIFGRCMAEDTNRVPAAAPPPPPEAVKETEMVSEMEEDNDRVSATAPPRPEAVKKATRISETAEDTKSMLMLLQQIYERFK